MSGYVFLANSTKPSVEKNNSRSPVVPGNVSIPCIEAALSMGYDVYLGTNRNNPGELECEYPVKLFDSHTYRSLTAFKDNRIAYDNLSAIVKENNVEVIHCNTPVGGLIGRLVGKKYRVKKIIYTAHGFHFYKGAPLFNCTVLKWAEQIMAHWTDAIITMNEEDYQAAQKFKLKKGGKVYKVHGVGINLNEYGNIPISGIRKEIGLRNNDFVCISAGDLVARKNYDTAIEAIAKCNNKRVHYLICGVGPENEKLQSLAKKMNVFNRIHFLGFRSDIKELMRDSDLFLFTTLQEGLPRSMMEAMACGLPCIASNIRGNVDLLDDKMGGYLCDCNDASYIAEKINVLADDEALRKSMSEHNLETIKKFDVSVVKEEIRNIYKEVLN